VHQEEHQWMQSSLIPETVEDGAGEPASVYGGPTLFDLND